jgi:hypothetical protein
MVLTMARRRLSNLGCSVLPNKRKPPFSGSATFGADAEESARFALSLSIAGESRNFRSRDPRNRFLAKVKDFPGCETQLKPAGFEPIDARMIHFRFRSATSRMPLRASTQHGAMKGPPFF